MIFKPVNKLSMLLAIAVFVLLVSCNSFTETPENAGAENPEEGSGSPAMVDNVAVEQRDGNYYAIVSGNYPDPCTAMSSVQQSVEDDTIKIMLLTASPSELMCAAVLTPFTVDILLTTGGLMPQEYAVVINDGPSATFAIGLNN